MNSRSRLVILISGNGSNLQAVLDACGQDKLPAETVAVVSNKLKAFGLTRTYKAGLPSVILPRRKDQPRYEYDRQLADIVDHFQPDWIVLAGWMRLLTNAFIGQFPNRVINLHPALPGMFPGLHAIERAYQAWQMGKISYTGVMVHLVANEGMDDGPLLSQRMVSMREDDTLETLEERMHAAEHDLLVETIRSLIYQGLERTIQNAKSYSFSL